MTTTDAEPNQQRAGRFGPFGGQFVPETLMPALAQLEAEWTAAKQDDEFQAELDSILRNYVGRPTALTHAERLTDQLGGAQIYLKREDLAHTGAHKINNAVGQVLLALRMGKRRIIAETGAGQHGVATATVCARYGLDCVVYAAAVMPRVTPDEYNFTKDRAILDVGLLGAVAWLNEAAAHMAAAGDGVICGISSIAGDRGRRPSPVYCTSKAALDTYLEALRNRLAPKGVGVVTIKPGYVDTAMTAGMEGLFWVITPEKAAVSIVRAIRRRRRQVYVPARWGLVGFVIRHIPSFIFKRLDF